MIFTQRVVSAICSICLLIAFAGALGGCASKAETKQQQDPQVILKQAKQAYFAKEYDRVFRLVFPLAASGNDQAQYTLGYLYRHGLGVERDDRQAMTWIQRAASQGNKKALDALR